MPSLGSQALSADSGSTHLGHGQGRYVRPTATDSMQAGVKPCFGNVCVVCLLACWLACWLACLSMPVRVIVFEMLALLSVHVGLLHDLAGTMLQRKLGARLMRSHSALLHPCRERALCRGWGSSGFRFLGSFQLGCLQIFLAHQCHPARCPSLAA